MIHARTRLSRMEYELGKILAIAIEKANRFRKNPDVTIGNAVLDSTGIDIQGTLGEIAYSKLFGLTPQINIVLPGERPEHADVLHNGAWVDVKATSAPGGGLIVPWTKDEKRIDLFALMIQEGDGRTFGFAGWATKEFALSHTYVPRFIPVKTCYYVYQHELSDDVFPIPPSNSRGFPGENGQRNTTPNGTALRVKQPPWVGSRSARDPRRSD